MKCLVGTRAVIELVRTSIRTSGEVRLVVVLRTILVLTQLPCRITRVAQDTQFQLRLSLQEGEETAIEK